MNNATLRQHVGVLLEHGKAPYKHEPDAKQSYFVRLRTDGGATETIWGIDLERAIADSGKTVGDGVCLTYLGSRMVKVDAIKKDEAGNPIGLEEIETERNEWKVDPWTPSAQLGTSAMDARLPTGRASRGPTLPSWKALPRWHSTSPMLGSEGVARLQDSVRSYAGTISNALTERRDTQTIRTFQQLLQSAADCIESSGYAAVQHAASDKDAAYLAALHAGTPTGEEDAKLIRAHIKEIIEFTDRAIAGGPNLVFSKEQLANDMLRPMREFKEAHEHTLKSITDQGTDLFQVIENTLRNLLDFIRSLFRRPDSLHLQAKGPNN